MSEKIDQDDIAAMLAEAQDAVDDISDAADDAAPGAGGIRSLPVDEDRMGLLGDVELGVSIELGRTEMMVEDVLRLGTGAVVELDKLAGDPVDVRVNGRLVARGEVIVLNDNFCIRVSEIVENLEDAAVPGATAVATSGGVPTGGDADAADESAEEAG